MRDAASQLSTLCEAALRWPAFFAAAPADVLPGAYLFERHAAGDPEAVEIVAFLRERGALPDR